MEEINLNLFDEEAKGLIIPETVDASQVQHIREELRPILQTAKDLVVNDEPS